MRLQKSKISINFIGKKSLKVITILFSIGATCAVRAEELLPIKFRNRADLQPGEKLTFYAGNEEYAISYAEAKDFINYDKAKGEEFPIGVEIHEEAGIVDFSSFGRITVSIPLEKITSAPPNAVSPGE